MKKEVNQDSTLEDKTPKEEVKTPTNQVETPNPSLENVVTQENPPAKNNILTTIIQKLKSFGMKKVMIIAAIVVILIALVTVKVITSTPKQVFKTAISNLYKETSNYLEKIDKTYEKFNLEKNPLLANIELNMDSNVEDITSSTEELGFEIKDVTINGQVGIDLDKKEMLFGGSLKGETEEINIDALVKDNNIYLVSNLFDDVVKVENSYDSPFYGLDSITEQLDLNNKIDFKVYDAILKSFTNALSKSLDSDSMEKESTEVDVVDKEIKVTKNSYELDDKALSDIIRSVADQLLDDDDFISNLSDTLDIDKSDIKDTLKEIKKDAKDIEYDDEVVINVYTRGILNNFAGFSFEIENDEYFTYYTDGKNVEITFDNNTEGYSQTKLNIQAVKDGKETDIEVKYNGEEILTATIKEFSDEVIDIEYEIKEDKEVVTKGTFYLTYKEDKESISGDYEIRLDVDDEYLSLKGKYEVKSSDKLTDIDTSKAITEDEVSDEEILSNLEEIAKKDKIFESLYNSAYESTLDLNYYDMAVLYGVEDVKEVLNKTQGTVLYVGSTGRTYGTGSETAIFNNLENAQEEYDFHTYYYSQSYINDEFRSLVSGVTPICNASQNTTTPSETAPTCTEYPTVYFIKDGKIVAAVQNTITKDELTKYLKEIGIA